MKIIIADDAKMWRDQARAALQRYPQIEIVGLYDNGLDALEAIKSLKPELALLDYVMPDKTGGEVCREVKALGLPTKVIMASSMGQRGAAFDLGADYVIIKPYNPALVKLALATIGVL